MKAITHYTFSAGASVYALSELGLLSWHSIAIALWLSLAVNYSIDALGHSNAGTPSRTRLTHSVFTAPLWGASVSWASVFVFSQMFPFDSQFTTLFWVVAGILFALGHLFLDSMTQAGVYYWRNRIAMAHLRYDNAVLNIVFISTGLGLFALTILQNLPSHGPTISLSLVGSVAGFYLERREAEGGN